MKFRDFPLQGSITYDIVDEAQKRVLKIGVEVKKVLEKHNIPYSLLFGSVIGSVRHKGFIPWDLDMDFGAFDNYEETVKILKEELPSWLVVLDNEEDPNYCAMWIKIADKYSEFHTPVFEGDNLFKYRGLHVDLCRISQTSYNSYNEYIKTEGINYFTRKFNAGLLSEESFKELTSKVINAYIEDTKKRPIIDQDFPEYAFLHFFEGKPDTIFPLKRYEFEGELFWGPNDYDKFLKSCFYKGDYMQMPPYEKRDMKMDEITIKPIPNI